MSEYRRGIEGIEGAVVFSKSFSHPSPSTPTRTYEEVTGWHWLAGRHQQLDPASTPSGSPRGPSWPPIISPTSKKALEQRLEGVGSTRWTTVVEVYPVVSRSREAVTAQRFTETAQRTNTIQSPRRR